MDKVLVFGTGKAADKFVNKIDINKIKIVGFLDNNKEKQWKIFKGKKIYMPGELDKLEYDYIIIASQYVDDIFKQLLKLNISEERIIPVVDNRNIEFSKKRSIGYLKSIMNKNRNTKKKIGLFVQNNSGSNTLALFKSIPDYITEKYKVEVINDNKKISDNDYDLICTTHFNCVGTPWTINIELWHGFPLKKIGVRALDICSCEENAQVKNNINYIVSYSELYSSLFNSAYCNDAEKYKICGMPRNDLLFKKNDELMKMLFGRDIEEKKIIAFLPTYRNDSFKFIGKSDGSRDWDNLLGLANWDLQIVAEFLRENNMILLTKLHPIEAEKIDKVKYEKYEDVIKFIDEKFLIDNEIDLYEILANIDMLITDYSSVYFDLLLKDIPLLFINNDIREYEEKRGFMLESYSNWTPGPKINDTNDFLFNLKQWDLDKYKMQRELIRNMVHRYKDNKSSDRVWKLIDYLLI